MAKLYYGNGECLIDGEGVKVRGVEIYYKGNAKFESTAGEGFTLMNANQRLLVFPIGWGDLKNLFKYKGDFKIKSFKVADEDGKLLTCELRKVMDYSQLINVNAEDMTLNSEDMNNGYFNESYSIKESFVIEGLNTSFPPVALFYKSGESYSGDFHIHKETGQAMTGATHTKDSVNLYIKVDKERKKEIDKSVRNSKLIRNSSAKKVEPRYQRISQNKGDKRKKEIREGGY